MFKTVLAACALLCAMTITADARTRSGPWSSCIPTEDVLRPCAQGANFLAGIKSIDVRMHRVHTPHPRKLADRESSLLPHPSGCPSRAFCGCGAAVRVFGSPVRSLWLASNWYRFPRTPPAPGMAAVRRHHVFVLEQHLEGSTWLAYDANSGGHGTRLHARSIAGFVIVNPHGAG